MKFFLSITLSLGAAVIFSIVAAGLFFDLALAAVPIVPGALGPRKTLVLIMAPPGGAFVATQAQAEAVMDQVDQAYRLASNNQTWFEGIKNTNAKADYFFYALTQFNASACSPSSNTGEAVSAARQAGYDTFAYKLIIGATPSQACPFHGSSFIGDRFAYSVGSSQITFRVWSHEIGHSLGLYHAATEGCNAYDDCGYQEYGDSPDVMSNSGEDDFNGFERERLGWAIYPVVGPGTYTLPAFNALGTPNSKAVKVCNGTICYYATYRPERGGIYIHRADETIPGSSRWITWVNATGNGVLGPGDRMDDTRRNISFEYVGAATFKVDTVTGATIPNAPQNLILQ